MNSHRLSINFAQFGLRNYSQNVNPIEKYYCRTKLRNFNVNYIKAGNGPHAVFCFPGILGAMRSHLIPLIEAFDKTKFTLYTWDQPGYGQSRPPERQFTIDSIQEDADMCVEFLQKFDHEKYSIMGWSGGGLSALLFVIQNPQLVNKFIPWGAFAYVDNEDADIFRCFRDATTWDGRMKETLLEEYDEEFFIKNWETWMDLLIQFNTERGGEFCAKGLSKILCPTLIMHGALDKIVLVKHASYLHQNIANSKLYIMEKGKHNIHLRFPDEFNSIVQNFLLSV